MRRISIINRPVVHFGVLYLCEVILPVYQLFDDVEVVCVGHILHGDIQSWCLQSLWGRKTQKNITRCACKYLCKPCNILKSFICIVDIYCCHMSRYFPNYLLALDWINAGHMHRTCIRQLLKTLVLYLQCWLCSILLIASGTLVSRSQQRPWWCGTQRRRVWAERRARWGCSSRPPPWQEETYRGDKCIAAMQGEWIAHQLELHHPVPKSWITISNPFKESEVSIYILRKSEYGNSLNSNWITTLPVQEFWFTAAILKDCCTI